jgi:hypothetical protein
MIFALAAHLGNSRNSGAYAAIELPS